LAGERQALVDLLMTARRAVGAARKIRDATSEVAARADVDRLKRALGERGPVWWTDGAPDLNRQMVADTLYAEWYSNQDRLPRLGVERLEGPSEP
jgi:hypothetical protein